MKADYTHITVILDRTGSMESIRDDTIGGFNAFLTAQQEAEAGRATLSLVQFDSRDPYEVIHHFAPLAEIPPLTRETFVPRATTPLLDALGRGMNDLESRLTALAERPSRVVFVVITDGMENASREFSKAQVAQMIRAKQKMYDWQFVFLSADIDAVHEAEYLGVATAAAMSFDRSAAGTRGAFESLSAKLANYRSGKCDQMAFDQDDRQKQKSERKRS